MVPAVKVTVSLELLVILTSLAVVMASGPESVTRKLSPSAMAPAVKVTVSLVPSAMPAALAVVMPSAPEDQKICTVAWRSCLAMEMLVVVTAPPDVRLSEDRMSVLPVPFSRFRPLNCAESTIETIWSRSAATSSWILPRSALLSCAATIRPFISCSRLVTCCDALRAKATVDDPKDSDSEIALKAELSEDITVEMAQMAALSRALEIFLPVET
jgi:hypothetical protein